MTRRPEITPLLPHDRPLKSGGGGGTFDGMEARVAVLETHVVHIREDIGETRNDVSALRSDVWSLKSDVSVLKSDVSTLKDDVLSLKADVSDLRKDMVDVKIGLATLTERVNHLPSKGFIVTSSLGIIGAIGTFIAFQDHIRALFSH